MEKKSIFRALQHEVMVLQGVGRPASLRCASLGLGGIEAAFPEGVFPEGAVHELVSFAPEEAAATSGFMAGIIGKLMRRDGLCLWVSTARKIFPPACSLFGLRADRVVFVEAATRRDALWAVEEGLKCGALSAVVGELQELSFTESRRLQLAVEKSRVTGFIHRCNPGSNNTLACAARWRIRPLASETREGMPGPGYPCWQVGLLKVRGGKPGNWEVSWRYDGFHPAGTSFSLPAGQNRKSG